LLIWFRRLYFVIPLNINNEIQLCGLTLYQSGEILRGHCIFSRLQPNFSRTSFFFLANSFHLYIFYFLKLNEFISKKRGKLYFIMNSEQLLFIMKMLAITSHLLTLLNFSIYLQLDFQNLIATLFSLLIDFKPRFLTLLPNFLPTKPLKLL